MKNRSLKVPELTTPRLRLEPLSLSHSDGMFEMWRQAAVQKYSGPAVDEHGKAIELPAQTRADSDRLIRFWAKAQRDGWGFRWALLSRSHGAFIGHLGFNSLLACSEIAYHANPHYWGSGFMTEAGHRAMQWRKAEGAKEVEAFIDPNNTASIALARRLGMNATNEFSEGAQRFCRTL